MPICVDSNILRLFGTNTDITDLRTIQDELSVAAERFNRIISSNIIGMSISDLDGGILSANKYYYDLIGYSEEEVRNSGILWSTITAPEYRSADARAVEELRREGTCSPYEKEFIRKDGTRIWVLVGATMLPPSKEQCITYFLDISESRHALSEAQARRAEIEAVLNSIPDGYIILDREGNIQKTNAQARTILGMTEQIEKLPLNELLSAFDYLDENGNRYSFEQLPLRRALHGETIREMTFQLKRDGKTRWISSSASPVMIEGKLQGVILEFVDLTRIFTLQKEIADERNFVNTILQTSGALIVVLDSDFKILRFNKASEALTGYSAEEVMNKSLFHLFVPDGEYNCAMKMIERLTLEKPLIECENHWKTRSGEYRFIRWRNSALVDSSGNVSNIIAAGIDITDRKQFEEQLQRYKDRLEYDFGAMNRLHEIASVYVGEAEIQKVFDQIVDTATALARDTMGSLQLLDIKSKSLQLRSARGLSDRWIEYWKIVDQCDGICGEAVISKKRISIENIADSPSFRGKPAYEILLKEGISAIQSTPIISRSGELLGVLTTYNYKPGLPDNHSLWVLDLLARQTADIIDRLNIQRSLSQSKSDLELHTQELYDANRDLESFSYSVSPDLRGPLSVIKGLTTIFEEDYREKFDDDGRMYIGKMKFNIEKMITLINDILKLSRIGRQEIRRENIDLSKMVRHYLEELSSLDPDRKTEFIIEDNVTVNADPQLVHVELENILKNSWKFTSKKDLTRIEFGRIHLDGKVAFYIKDNGAGFDQKFANTIFEPFKQIHHEREYSGTGIGLSIVQRVVKKHNGTIWAKGTPGEGAVFYFTLDG
jgi:PAS domain S-box-containing protein